MNESATIPAAGTITDADRSEGIDEEINEMARAGVHIGHAKAKSHPAMAPYIFSVRNAIAIIDLLKSKEKLQQACSAIKGIAAHGGMILMVGTRPTARKIIQEAAERTVMPYVTERWIGGALTNFKVILKRIEYMEGLEKERATGGLEKYTKRERLKKDEEIARLQKLFGGIRTLKRLPDAICIIDITHDETAVQEARRIKIPVVALIDTNANPREIDFPIPSNDDAVSAVRYIVGRIVQAIEEGKNEAAAVQAEKTAVSAS